ncbi:MAG: hypothetical protein JO337_04765 [Acidimicrobiales bacterium]|nr:hypothetical protein [Acidimicrobiales bacterium]
MPGPATFLATATFDPPAGGTATGTVTFTPQARSTPTGYVVAQQPVVATLSAGAISQSLVQGIAYTVLEQITGAQPAAYTIPGNGNIDLSTISSLVSSAYIPNAYMGAWSSTTTYQIGQIVASGGVNYVALQSTTNQTPASNPSAWLALSITSGAHPWEFRVSAYGAVGNCQIVADGAISSSSSTTTLTCATSMPFKSTDVGKSIRIDGAGASGIGLVTTITGFTSSSVVTVGAAASTTVSGAIVAFGTDDTAAINAAQTAAGLYAIANNGYAEVLFDPLYYTIAGPVTTHTFNGGSAYDFGQIFWPIVVQTGNGPQIEIAWKGKSAASEQNWEMTAQNLHGTMLISLSNGANPASANGAAAVVSGPTNALYTVGTFHFPAAVAQVDQVYISTPDQSAAGYASLGIGAWNFQKMGAVNHGIIGAVKTGRYNSNMNLSAQSTNDFGLYMPLNSNTEPDMVDYFNCQGYYLGLGVAEHTQIKQCSLQQCRTAIQVEGGYWHQAQIGYASVSNCPYVLTSNGFGPSSLDCFLDIEDPGSGPFNTVLHIYDPNGAIDAGEIRFGRSIAPGTPRVYTIGVNGLYGGVKIKDHWRPRGLISGALLPASGTASFVQDSGGTQVWRDCMVTISGGTVTGISVAGVSLGITSGTFVVPSFQQFTLTYSVAPTIHAFAM